MSTALFFLCKAGITLAGLYLVFWFFLRKETFHQLKRFVLLANLVLSLILPLLNMAPLKLHLEKTNYTPLIQNTAITSQFTLPVSQPAMPVTDNFVHWIGIAGFLYLAVVLVLLAKFSIQLFSVYKLIRNAHIISQFSFVLAASKKANSPFSFFRYLILNPKQYEADTLSQIIQHEQVHIDQHHSFDRLISEVYTIFFWFNPFAWLHQNQLKINLEYIADRAVLNAGFSAESYQSNLFRLTLPEPGFRLTNNFNQSGLLNRIRMMNKPASPFSFRLKIAFIIPALIGLIALCNGTQAKKAESMLQVLTQARQSSAFTPMILAQDRTITGMVKDADTDKPLSGVLIQVKGQATGIQTDANGKFSINVNETDKALVFQLESFNVTEMAITPLAEMIVLLKFTDRPIGYSTQTYFSDSTYVVNIRKMLERETNWKTNGWSIDIDRSDNALPDDVLYLIDGIEVDKSAYKRINKNTIEAIIVFANKVAIRKYGAYDKRGVVDIQLLKK